MIGCKWQAGCSFLQSGTCSSQCENQIPVQMKSKSTKQLNSLKGIQNTIMTSV